MKERKRLFVVLGTAILGILLGTGAAFSAGGMGGTNRGPGTGTAITNCQANDVGQFECSAD